MVTARLDRMQVTTAETSLGVMVRNTQPLTPASQDSVIPVPCPEATAVPPVATHPAGHATLKLEASAEA